MIISRGDSRVQFSTVIFYFGGELTTLIDVALFNLSHFIACGRPMILCPFLSEKNMTYKHDSNSQKKYLAGNKNASPRKAKAREVERSSFDAQLQRQELNNSSMIPGWFSIVYNGRAHLTQMKVIIPTATAPTNTPLSALVMAIQTDTPENK